MSPSQAERTCAPAGRRSARLADIGGDAALGFCGAEAMGKIDADGPAHPTYLATMRAASTSESRPPHPITSSWTVMGPGAARGAPSLGIHEHGECRIPQTGFMDAELSLS